MLISVTNASSVCFCLIRNRRRSLYQEHLQFNAAIFVSLIFPPSQFQCFWPKRKNESEFEFHFSQARKIEKRNEKSDVVFHEKKRGFEKGTLFHFYSSEEKRKTKTHLNFIFLYSIENRLG